MKERAHFKASQGLRSSLRGYFYSNELIACVANPNVWGEIIYWIFEDTKPTRVMLEDFVGQKKTNGALFSLLSTSNDS